MNIPTFGPLPVPSLIAMNPENSYIVDLEDWVESTEDDIWRDTHYIGWNLVEAPNGTLGGDMSR